MRSAEVLQVADARDDPRMASKNANAFATPNDQRVSSSCLPLPQSAASSRSTARKASAMLYGFKLLCMMALLTTQAHAVLGSSS